jgi:hypothetical protein
MANNADAVRSAVERSRPMPCGVIRARGQGALRKPQPAESMMISSIRWGPSPGIEKFAFVSIVSRVAARPRWMLHRTSCVVATSVEARCWWRWAITIEVTPVAGAYLGLQCLSSRLRSSRSASATSSGLASSRGCTPSASARARTVRVDGAVRPLSRRVIVNACTPDRRASSAWEKKCSRRRRRKVSLNGIRSSGSQVAGRVHGWLHACIVLHEDYHNASMGGPRPVQSRTLTVMC